MVLLTGAVTTHQRGASDDSSAGNCNSDSSCEWWCCRQVRSPRTDVELVMTILLAIATVILAVNGGVVDRCGHRAPTWS